MANDDVYAGPPGGDRVLARGNDATAVGFPFVIHSDDQVRDAYNDPAIQDTIRRWWGDSVFRADNTINRSAIAARVFGDSVERHRLEHLLHPWVNEAREQAMSAVADDPQVLAFIWDTPLLYETGLNRQCDAVVYVNTPDDARLERLKSTRGWDAAGREGRERPSRLRR